MGLFGQDSTNSKSETLDSQQTSSEVFDLSGSELGGTVINIDSLGGNTFQGNLTGQNRSNAASRNPGGRTSGGNLALNNGDGGPGGGGNVDTRAFGAEQTIVLTLNEGNDVSAELLLAAQSTLEGSTRATLDAIEIANTNTQGALAQALDFANSVSDRQTILAGQANTSLADLAGSFVDALGSAFSQLADFTLAATTQSSDASLRASQAFNESASRGAAAGGGSPVVIVPDQGQISPLLVATGAAVAMFALTRLLK